MRGRVGCLSFRRGNGIQGFPEKQAGTVPSDWVRAGADKRDALRLAARHRAMGVSARQGVHLRRLRARQDGDAARMGAPMRGARWEKRARRRAAHGGASDGPGGREVRHGREVREERGRRLRAVDIRDQLRDGRAFRHLRLRGRGARRVEHHQGPRLKDPHGADRTAAGNAVRAVLHRDARPERPDGARHARRDSRRHEARGDAGDVLHARRRRHVEMAAEAPCRRRLLPVDGDLGGDDLAPRRHRLPRRRIRAPRTEHQNPYGRFGVRPRRRAVRAARRGACGPAPRQEGGARVEGREHRIHGQRIERAVVRLVRLQRRVGGARQGHPRFG